MLKLTAPAFAARGPFPAIQAAMLAAKRAELAKQHKLAQAATKAGMAAVLLLALLFGCKPCQTATAARELSHETAAPRVALADSTRAR